MFSDRLWNIDHISEASLVYHGHDLTTEKKTRKNFAYDVRKSIYGKYPSQQRKETRGTKRKKTQNRARKKRKINKIVTDHVPESLLSSDSETTDEEPLTLLSFNKKI